MFAYPRSEQGDFVETDFFSVSNNTQQIDYEVCF